MVETYQQIKDNTVIGFQELGSRTRDYINKADPGTLRGTVYSHDSPQETLERYPGLREADRLTINTGRLLTNPNLSPRDFSNKQFRSLHPDIKDYKERLEFSKQLKKQGVDVREYGDPRRRQSLHSKMFLGEHNDRESLYVTTSNLAKTNNFNIGIKYRDPEIIGEAKQFLTEVERGERPTSREHIKTGQEATNNVIKMLERAEEGAEVTVTSPFIDDERVASAIAGASKRGVDIELITDDDSSGMNSRKEVKGRLKSSGVDVLAPEGKRMVHTKAVAIKTAEGKYKSAFGSHNLTRSASQGRTHDIFIFNQGKTSKELFGKINSQNLEESVNLEKVNTQEFVSYNQIERRMLSRGLTHYRVGSDGKSVSTDLNLPYHPISLSSDFFTDFQNRQLPNLTPYSDLYKARMGEEPPNSVRRLDKALMSPGIGEQINRTFGTELYHSGEGIIGSALHSSGRFIDWTFGHQEYSREEEIREEETQGTPRGMFQYLDREQDHDGGVFEWLIGTTGDMAKNIATAVGFYTFVNIPTQHLRSKLIAEPIRGLLQSSSEHARDTVKSKFQRSFSRTARNIVFGPEYGEIISGTIEEVEKESLDYQEKRRKETPSTIPQKFSEKLSAYRSQTSDPDKRAQRLLNTVFNSDNQELDYVEWKKSSGFVGLVSSFREFEQARFSSVIRPVLEAMNPYGYKNHLRQEYENAISDLERAIGESPRVIHKSGDSRKQDLEFRGMGSQRVTRIASQVEKIGHLLPLNIAYWVPSIRKGLNLPEFDPSKQMTWSRAWPLGQISKFTENILSFSKGVVQKPGELVKDAKEAWRLNNELQKQKFSKQVDTPTVSDPEVNPSQRGDYKEALWKEAEVAYKSGAQSLEDIERDSRFQTYTKTQHELDKTVRKIEARTPDRPLGEEFLANDPDAGASPTMNPETYRRGLRARRFLMGAGALLFADTLVERLFMGSGPSILTQLSAASGLKTDEGEVARFEFQGNVPNLIGIAGLAAGYAAGGYLYPHLDDTGEGLINFSQGRDIGTQFSVKKAETIGNKVAKDVSSQRKQETEQAKERYLNLKNRAESYRHKRLRFSHGRATGTALVAGIGIKATTSFLAGVSNLLFNTGGPFEAVGRAVGSLFGASTSEKGLKLKDEDAVFAMSLEDELVNLIDRADSREEKARSVLGKYIMESAIGETKESGDTFSVARQLNIPFFQMSAVARTKPFEDKMILGFGPQLMPSSGLGINSIIPLGIRTAPKELTKKEQDFLFQQEAGDLSLGETLSSQALAAVELATGTGAQGPIAGIGDSGYLTALDFLGLTGAAMGIGSTLGKIKTPGKKKPLSKVIDEGISSREELNRMREVTAPLRRGIGNVYGKAHNVVGHLLAFPFHLGRGIGKATEIATRSVTQATTLEDSEWMERANSKGKTYKERASKIAQSRLFRRAALIYGVTMFSSAMAMEDSGYQATFEDRSERFQAVLGTTAVYSTAILKSGAIDTQEELASRFLSNTRKGKIKQEMERILPFSSSKSDHAQTMMGKVAKAGARLVSPQTHTGKSFAPIPSRLVADAASDYLIEESWKEAGFREEVPKYGKGTRSLRGRFGLAATGIVATKLFAHRAISILPSDWANTLTETPFIGPTLSMLTGYEDEYKFMDEYRENESHPFANSIGWISRTLTAGYFDFSETFGLYTDKPDPYIDLLGPFGVSFKEDDVKYYSQYQGTVTDFSLATHSLAEYGFRKYNRLREVLSEGDYSSMEGAIDQFLSYQYRNSPVQFSRMKESEREAAGSLTKRVLAIREMHLQNIAHKAPVENFLNKVMLDIRTGRMSDPSIPEGELDRIWNPFDTFSTLTGRILRTDDLGGAITSTTVKEMYQAETLGAKFITQKGSSIGDILWGKGFDEEDSNVPEPITDLVSMVSFLTSSVATIAGSAGVAYSGFTALNYLGRKRKHQTVSELFGNSQIRGKGGVVRPERYRFVEVDTPQGKKVVQYDAKSQTLGGTLYGFNANDLSYTSNISQLGIQGSSVVKTNYKDWAFTVNNYFTQDFASVLSETIEQNYNSNRSQSEIWREFKLKLHDSAENRLKPKLQKKVGGGSQLSVFDLLFRDQPTYNVDDFIKENFDQAMDPLIEDAQRIWTEQRLGELDPIEAEARLISYLEETTSFRNLTSRLTRPTTAGYNKDANERFTERTKKEVNKDYNKEKTNKQTQTYKYNTSFKLRSQSLFEESLKGSWGALEVGGWWMSTGTTAYSAIEATTVALDPEKDTFFRRHAAKEAVKETTFFGLSAAISRIVGTAVTGFGVGGPIGAVAATVAGIGIEIGASLLLSEGGMLDDAFKSFQEFTADLTVNSPISDILGPASDVVGGVASFGTSVLEKTVVPFLSEQRKKMETSEGGSAVAWAKSLLLPRTVYYSMGGSQFQQRAKWRFQKALKPNRGVSADTVHPLMLGSPMDEREWEMSQMYFKGHSGSRLLQEEFGAHQYRMSNILRLYLERQQGLYDQRVVGDQANRLGADKSAFSMGAIGLGTLFTIASVAFTQREAIRHALTGDNSKQIKKKALEELGDIKRQLDIDESQVVHNIEKSRRGKYGRFNYFGLEEGQRNQVTLSSSVENILGRNRAGRMERARRGEYLQARFTALHEFAHAKQFEVEQIATRHVSNDPWVSQNENRVLVSESEFRRTFDGTAMSMQQKDRVIKTAKDLALQSAERTAKEVERNRGRRLSRAEFRDVYQKEFDANLTAMRYASDKESVKAQARDISKLERKIRPEEKKRHPDSSRTTFANYEEEIDFYYKQTLYSDTSQKTAGVNEYIKYGVNSAKDFVSNVKQGLKTYFGELEASEKAEIDDYMRRVFDKEGRESFSQIIKRNQANISGTPGLGKGSLSFSKFRFISFTRDSYLLKDYLTPRIPQNKGDDYTSGEELQRVHNESVRKINGRQNTGLHELTDKLSSSYTDALVRFSKSYEFGERDVPIYEALQSVEQHGFGKRSRALKSFIFDASYINFTVSLKINEAKSAVTNDNYDSALKTLTDLHKEYNFQNYGSKINKMQKEFLDKIYRVDEDLYNKAVSLLEKDKENPNLIIGDMSKIAREAVARDHREVMDQALDEFFDNFGSQLNALRKTAVELLGEAGKRAVRKITEPFDPILRPLAGAYKNVGIRWRKSGAGQILGEALDKAFTIGDTLYGRSVQKQTAKLNDLEPQESTGKLSEDAKEEVLQAAKHRLAAKMSTFLGTGIQFFGNQGHAITGAIFSFWSSTGTANIKFIDPEKDRQQIKEENDPLKLVLYDATGMGADIVQSFLSFVGVNVDKGDIHRGMLSGDWSTFASYQAEKDIERLEEGKAVYDSIQSTSQYIRLHKDFSVHQSATKAATQGLSESVKEGLTKTLDKLGVAIKTVVKPLIRAAFPIAMGAYQLGMGAYQVARPIVSFATEHIIRPAKDLFTTKIPKWAGQAANLLKKIPGLRSFAQNTKSFLKTVSNPHIATGVGGLGGTVALFSMSWLVKPGEELSKEEQKKLKNYEDRLEEGNIGVLERLDYYRLSFQQWVNKHAQTIQGVSGTLASFFLSSFSFSSIYKGLKEQGKAPRWMTKIAQGSSKIASQFGRFLKDQWNESFRLDPVEKRWLRLKKFKAEKGLRKFGRRVGRKTNVFFEKRNREAKNAISKLSGFIRRDYQRTLSHLNVLGKGIKNFGRSFAGGLIGLGISALTPEDTFDNIYGGEQLPEELKPYLQHGFGSIAGQLTQETSKLIKNADYKGMRVATQIFAQQKAIDLKNRAKQFGRFTKRSFSSIKQGVKSGAYSIIQKISYWAERGGIDFLNWAHEKGSRFGSWLTQKGVELGDLLSQKGLEFGSWLSQKGVELGNLARRGKVKLGNLARRGKVGLDIFARQLSVDARRWFTQKGTQLGNLARRGKVELDIFARQLSVDARNKARGIKQFIKSDLPIMAEDLGRGLVKVGSSATGLAKETYQKLEGWTKRRVREVKVIEKRRAKLWGRTIRDWKTGLKQFAKNADVAGIIEDLKYDIGRVSSGAANLTKKTYQILEDWTRQRAREVKVIEKRRAQLWGRAIRDWSKRKAKEVRVRSKLVGRTLKDWERGLKQFAKDADVAGIIKDLKSDIGRVGSGLNNVYQKFKSFAPALGEMAEDFGKGLAIMGSGTLNFLSNLRPPSSEAIKFSSRGLIGAGVGYLGSKLDPEIEGTANEIATAGSVGAFSLVADETVKGLRDTGIGLKNKAQLWSQGVRKFIQKTDFKSLLSRTKQIGASVGRVNLAGLVGIGASHFTKTEEDRENPDIEKELARYSIGYLSGAYFQGVRELDWSGERKTLRKFRKFANQKLIKSKRWSKNLVQQGRVAIGGVASYLKNYGRRSAGLGIATAALTGNFFDDEESTSMESLGVASASLAVSHAPELTKVANSAGKKARKFAENNPQTVNKYKQIGRWGVGLGLQTAIWSQFAEDELGWMTTSALSFGAGAFTFAKETGFLASELGKRGKLLGDKINRNYIYPLTQFLDRSKNSIRSIGGAVKEGIKSPLRKASKTLTAKGFWQGSLDFLSGAFQIAETGFAVKSVSSLGKDSSEADYELAMATLRKRRRGLLGSVVGQAYFGDIGETLLSIGLDVGSDVKHEDAELWEASDTSGEYLLAREARMAQKEYRAAFGIASKTKTLVTRRFGKYASKLGASEAATQLAREGSRMEAGEVTELIKYIEGETGEKIPFKNFTQKIVESIKNGQPPQDELTKKALDSGFENARNWVNIRARRSDHNFISRTARRIIGKAHKAYSMGKTRVQNEIARRYQNIMRTDLNGNPVQDPNHLAHTDKRIGRFARGVQRHGSGFLRDLMNIGQKIQEAGSKVARGSGKGSKFLRGAGKTLRHGIPVAGDLIDLYMISSGTKKLVEADSESGEKAKKMKIEGYSRATEGAFSLAGGAIGGYLGGPIGSAIGSIVLAGIGRRYGKSVAKRGTQDKNVNMKDVARGSMFGGVTGMALGGLAAIGLTALTLGTGGLALAAVGAAGIAGAGAGGAAGWVAGGETTLYRQMGQKDYMKAWQGEDESSQRSQRTLYAYSAGSILSEKAKTKSEKSSKEKEEEKKEKPEKFKTRLESTIENKKKEEENQFLFNRMMETVNNWLFGETRFKRVKRKEEKGTIASSRKVEQEGGLFSWIGENIVDPVKEGFKKIGQGIKNITDRISIPFFTGGSRREPHQNLSGSVTQSLSLTAERPPGPDFNIRSSKKRAKRESWYSSRLSDKIKFGAEHPYNARVTDVPRIRQKGPHHGIDIAGTSGMRLRNPFQNAAVVRKFRGERAGNTLVIEQLDKNGKPTGRRMTVMHLRGSETYQEIGPGYVLSPNEFIGTQGNTGVGTGAHFHIEEKVKNEQGKWERVAPDVNMVAATLSAEKVVKRTPKKVSNEIAIAQPVLQLLRQGEGGYGSINRGSAGDTNVSMKNWSGNPTGKPLTEMTIKQVMSLQADPDGSNRSDPNTLWAVGAYQFIPKTLQKAVQWTEGVSKDDKMTRGVQAKLAISLMKNKRPEMWNYIAGRSDSEKDMALAFAKEWASVGVPPNMTKKDENDSFYGDVGNNSASIRWQEMVKAVNKSRKLYQDALLNEEGVQGKISDPASFSENFKVKVNEEGDSNNTYHIGLGHSGTGSPGAPVVESGEQNWRQRMLGEKTEEEVNEKVLVQVQRFAEEFGLENIIKVYSGRRGDVGGNLEKFSQKAKGSNKVFLSGYYFGKREDQHYLEVHFDTATQLKGQRGILTGNNSKFTQSLIREYGKHRSQGANHAVTNAGENILEIGASNSRSVRALAGLKGEEEMNKEAKRQALKIIRAIARADDRIELERVKDQIEQKEKKKQKDENSKKEGDKKVSLNFSKISELDTSINRVPKNAKDIPDRPREELWDTNGNRVEVSSLKIQEDVDSLTLKGDLALIELQENVKAANEKSKEAEEKNSGRVLFLEGVFQDTEVMNVNLDNSQSRKPKTEKTATVTKTKSFDGSSERVVELENEGQELYDNFWKLNNFEVADGEEQNMDMSLAETEQWMEAS
jgi:murein DD-endopeptidase MepM/ murein hydrolase activator NlpD